jgi:hypothetical protein
VYTTSGVTFEAADPISRDWTVAFEVDFGFIDRLRIWTAGSLPDVNALNQPPVVVLPKREAPLSLFETRSLVAHLRDVTRRARARRFGASAAHTDIAPLQVDRLLPELIERLVERLHIHAGPHRLRSARIKCAERLLILI